MYNSRQYEKVSFYFAFSNIDQKREKKEMINVQAARPQSDCQFVIISFMIIVCLSFHMLITIWTKNVGFYDNKNMNRDK